MTLNGTVTSILFLKNVSKYISSLRKLKYVSTRKNLEKLFLIYIRPLLEYAYEVWDNCGETYSNKLENVQLEAARIITGLPIFTKKEFIYRELCWTTLRERRSFWKINLLFNIRNRSTPEYMLDLLPNTMANTSNDNLRNCDEYRLPNNRLQLSKKKYIDTKQSNKRNNQNSKVKRQDYNMK